MGKRFFTQFLSKAFELQNFLRNHQYFSKDCLPGIADALMFQLFDIETPDKHKFPLIYYWYINVKQFSPDAISNWTIESDKDFQFLDILTSYQQKNQQRSDSATLIKTCENKHIKDILQTKQMSQNYCLKIRLNTVNETAIAQISKKLFKKQIILQKRSQIISCQFIGGLMKLKIFCNRLKLQLIKWQLERSKYVSYYEMLKDKKYKIQRAQTLNQNCN